MNLKTGKEKGSERAQAKERKELRGRRKEMGEEDSRVISVPDIWQY